MKLVRTRAAWLAAATLAVQIGVIGSAAALLCCGPEHAGAMDEMACCKEAGGAPHVCPLTRAPKPGVPQMDPRCTPDQQALAALFTLVGPPEAAEAFLWLPPVFSHEMPAVEQPLTLVAPPDLPPPRI